MSTFEEDRRALMERPLVYKNMVQGLGVGANNATANYPNYYYCGTSNNTGGSLLDQNTVYEYKIPVPEWKSLPAGITLTGAHMTKATDREYLIIDLDTNQILATAKTEPEADEEAANQAARTDHRITVFKPVATHAPEKKTTKKSITL